MVGDRVLIKPRAGQDRTESGLYLPPSVKEKENLSSGFVIKVGPGYPIPAPSDDEPWMDEPEQKKYFALQANEGDQAVYLRSAGHEIEFDKEKYVIIPHNAIMMLVRDEGLFT